MKNFQLIVLKYLKLQLIVKKALFFQEFYKMNRERCRKPNWNFYSYKFFSLKEDLTYVLL